MKPTKVIKKKYPDIKFGKVQKAFKCHKSIRSQAPFKLCEIYVGRNSSEFKDEVWACISENENPDECEMQEILDI